MPEKKEWKNKKTNSKLFNEKDGGFGKYKESTGGGKPIDPDGRGNTDSTSIGGKGRGAMARKGEHRDSDQPRTSDGKFTYNSVNGKGIKEAKSRGTTVNPLLTGGENGVHHGDFKRKTKVNGKVVWEKVSLKDDEKAQQRFKEWAEKTQWWEKGDEIVGFDGKIHLAPESLVELTKKYDPETGTFVVLSEDEKGKPKFIHEDVNEWNRKKSGFGTGGSYSKNEKGAMQEAAEKGMLGRWFVPNEPNKPTESGFKNFVPKFKNSLSNILKKGEQEPTPTPIPTQEPIAPTPAPQPNPIVPPTSQEQPKQTYQTPRAEKVSNNYTQEQIDNVYRGSGQLGKKFQSEGNEEGLRQLSALRKVFRNEGLKENNRVRFDNAVQNLEKYLRQNKIRALEEKE